VLATRGATHFSKLLRSQKRASSFTEASFFVHRSELLRSQKRASSFTKASFFVHRSELLVHRSELLRSQKRAFLVGSTRPSRAPEPHRGRRLPAAPGTRREKSIPLCARRSGHPPTCQELHRVRRAPHCTRNANREIYSSLRTPLGPRRHARNCTACAGLPTAPEMRIEKSIHISAHGRLAVTADPFGRRNTNREIYSHFRAQSVRPPTRVTARANPTRVTARANPTRVTARANPTRSTARAKLPQNTLRTGSPLLAPTSACRPRRAN